MKPLKAYFLHLPQEIKLVKTDGIANIFLSEYILSFLVWLCVFLASCTACVYLIATSVLEFNEFKVISTVRYTNEPKAVLPTLTFCNLDPFTSEFALSLIAKAKSNGTMFEQPGVDQPVDYWKMYLQLEEYLNATRGYYLTDSEKLSLSNFNQTIIPKANNFALRDQFERIFHPKYFGCLRYNSNGSTTTTSSENFLEITFFIDTPTPSVLQLYPANMKGLYLFIQNRFGTFLSCFEYSKY